MSEPGAEFSAFLSSLETSEPPRLWPKGLRALWFAHKGDLDRALAIVDHPADAEEAWVLAHLRRSAGDLASARYWYAQALRDVPVAPLELERENIITSLLAGD
jgi:hypothetical protein